jgi:predicted O-linked N-acetylglucosamine transferase (SPINDLY family)
MNSAVESRFQAAQKALEAGDKDSARSELHEVLQLAPHHAGAHNLVGFIALRDGNPRDAEAWFRKAIDADPGNRVFRENMELARSLQEQLSATAPLRARLAADPRQPELWRKLAQAEAAGRNLDAALAALHEGLSHCPERPELLHLLANYLHYLGRLPEAATHYHHAIRVAPQPVDARIDLSLVYLRLLNGDLAEKLAREAVDGAPESARAAVNLGTVLYQRNRFTEALAHLERGRALQPEEARTYNQLGMTWSALGDVKQALAHFRRGLARKADYAVVRSNLMLTLLYSDEAQGKDIFEEARRFGSSMLVPAAPSHRNAPDTERRLRIGFVSGDFRRHVVGMFLLPLFMHRNRASAEYLCYSLIDAPDPFTRMLARNADAWVDARALDEAQFAARVEADAVDILVDLTGHTSDNRLAVFARRPAPVQATWLGYPGTTGALGIDYRLTDAVLDPPGSEALSTERPVRLESGFFCYAPLPEWGGSLPVGALPAVAKGHVTFGAFNNLAKVSPTCVHAWAEILRRVPDSRLVSRAKPFGDAAARERFVSRFTALGIDATRIEPLPYLPDPARHLEIYNDVDIHLDSLPYAGGTTTCDALWMGVPVVTLAGDRPSARLGATVLTRLALAELIASSLHEYVEIAVRLAGDAGRLTQLRADMRSRFTASPVHDAAAFAAGFERALRSLWREWCEIKVKSIDAKDAKDAKENTKAGGIES